MNMKERRKRRALKYLDEQIALAHRGSDVAYDMAMNDGGAAIRRLEARIAELRRERDALARAA